MNNAFVSALHQYLAEGAIIDWKSEDIPMSAIPDYTPGMAANSYFFGHPVWGKEYFESEHRSAAFKERWLAAMGSWDGKIVVDVGCGPGNVYANLGGSPKILIGVDISLGALKNARQLGYTTLLADDHNIPFIDGFADIVIVNATLHHSDDMARVLAEAARLVRPGGLLVADQDPQLSAWKFKGLGLFLRNIRFPLYKLIGSKYYIPKDEWTARLATELHNHKSGDGVTPELYYQVLKPLGFIVELHPHNHDLGAEVMQGKFGRLPWRFRLSQWLSGINPNTREAAQSIMCIARKSSD